VKNFRIHVHRQNNPHSWTLMSQVGKLLHVQS